MNSPVHDNATEIGGTPESALLENQLLRLFVGAFLDQAAVLAKVIDESLEDVSTESDPRFESLRRLRTLYRTFLDDPDEAQLTAIFIELSDGEPVVSARS